MFIYFFTYLWIFKGCIAIWYTMSLILHRKSSIQPKTMREINLPKTKSVDNVKAKNKAGKTRPKSILEAFEYIVELAENSNLDSEFLKKSICSYRICGKYLGTVADASCFALAIRWQKRRLPHLDLGNCKLCRLPNNQDTATFRRYWYSRNHALSSCIAQQ